MTQGERSGRVVIGSDKRVDLENPVNAAYALSHGWDGNTSGTETGTSQKKRAVSGERGHRKAPSGDVEPPETDSAAEDGQKSPLGVRRLIAQTQNWEAQRDSHRLRQAERLRLLVHIDVLRKMWNAAGTELQTGLVDLPDRVGAQIAAIIKAGGEASIEEIKAILRSEADQVLRRHRDAGKAAGKAAGVRIEG